jgi:hypothetical protein
VIFRFFDVRIGFDTPSHEVATQFCEGLLVQKSGQVITGVGQKFAAAESNEKAVVLLFGVFERGTLGKSSEIFRGRPESGGVTF